MSKNIALLFGSLIFSLALLNSAVNYMGLAPQNVSYWSTNVRAMKQRHTVSDFDVTYQTNLQGLRASATIEKKPDNILRVAVLGDSYTFGWGVDENGTIPYFLQQKLRKEFETSRIEVINFGVPGVNPINFAKFNKQYVGEIGADIVVTNIFKVRNTYHGDNTLATEAGIENWVEGVEKFSSVKDIDPDKGISGTIFWRFALSRLVYRAAHNIDYKYHGVAWPGVKHTVFKDQTPAGVMRSLFEKYSTSIVPRVSAARASTVLPGWCVAQREATRLCEPGFGMSLPDPNSRILYDLYKATGVLQEACECRAQPTATFEHLLKASDHPAMMRDRLGLAPETQRLRENEIKFLAKTLRSMKNVAEARGSDFVAMIFPVSWLFLEYTPEEYAKRNGLLWVPGLISHSPMDQHIKKYCEVEGVNCSNGTNQMMRFAKGKPASELNFHDSHNTELTNAVIADIILDTIRPHVTKRLATMSVD